MLFSFCLGSSARQPCWLNHVMLVKLGEGCPQYLNQEYRHNSRAYGIHEAHVVTDEGLAAATAVQVQVLTVVVVVVVRCIVQDLLLDAGTRGSRVTTAEWDTIH